MSLWLFRAGKNGEYEDKFLIEGRVYLTWDDFDVDLKKIDSQEALYKILIKKYDLPKEKTAINWASQIWPIAHKMKVGDWVVLPSKMNRTLHFGKITGDYIYDKSLGNPYYHYRDIDWFALDIPRDRFDQDILYSLGAFMTVCSIHKNNAEERIKQMAKNNWYTKSKIGVETIEEIEEESKIDLEEYIFDQISERIIQKFKGHRMEDLINEILKAKGFTTYRSPEGADHGVDLLASPDTLGFGSPKICIQVKTNDTPTNKYKTVFSVGDVLDRSIYVDTNPFIIRDEICTVGKYNQEKYKGVIYGSLVEDIEIEIAINIDKRMTADFPAYIGMTWVDPKSTDQRKQFWKSLIRTFSVEYMTITSYII